MEQYRCKEIIKAYMYGGGYIVLHKNSIWDVEEVHKNDVSLFCSDKSKNDGCFISISKDELNECFEKVEECKE